MSLDEELIQAFLEESTENLDQLDLDLVALESDADNPELLSRIFRTIHTIKGTCGFLNFGDLEGLAHAGEDLLAELRDGTVTLDAAVTSSLLGLVDRIRAVLAVVERTGTEGDFDHSSVIADLRQSRQRRATPAVVPPAPTPLAPPEGLIAAAEETSVRIDVAVLDHLQDLVSELTLARLRVGAHVPDDGGLAQAFRQLTATTRDLQDTVMQARLQPVSTATDRLRRIVRDLAAREGKVVHLHIEGGDVLVDKAINEVLRDPLVHLVRNAVDHGIEFPEQRTALGKSAEATVRIEAAVIGGGFQIEVTDDGRGINGARLVDKAIAAGQLSADRATTLTETERVSLLFLPGVSTASEVTTISGRGVGMDVVRSNLEQIGGSIDVWSEPGMGTTFRISVPLTLAILPALVVRCGQDRYTIPQADVQAIVRVHPSNARDLIEEVGGVRLLHHHQSLLPLVNLAHYLGITATAAGEDLEIVVVERLDRTYGLVVDAVGDSVEAVVKPLPRALRGLACYAGVTVLSDGQPCLILETSAPAIEAGLSPQSGPTTEPLPPSDPNQRPFLVATVADNRLAIPLDHVHRLLTVASSTIEHSGHDEVVQYQGGILGLIRLDRLLDIGAAQDSADLTVVVCSATGAAVGLVVDEVNDIEWANPAQAEHLEEPCLSGRMVIAGRAADLVALDAVVAHGLHRHPGPTGGGHA